MDTSDEVSTDFSTIIPLTCLFIHCIVDFSDSERRFTLKMEDTVSKKVAECWNTTSPKYWDRPCAGAGLLSYRYKGQYGWIMIGARDDAEALSEAKRSITVRVDVHLLEKWDGERYVSVK